MVFSSLPTKRNSCSVAGVMDAFTGLIGSGLFQLLGCSTSLRIQLLNTGSSISNVLPMGHSASHFGAEGLTWPVTEQSFVTGTKHVIHTPRKHAIKIYIRVVWPWACTLRLRGISAFRSAYRRAVGPGKGMLPKTLYLAKEELLCFRCIVLSLLCSERGKYTMSKYTTIL